MAHFRIDRMGRVIFPQIDSSYQQCLLHRQQQPDGYLIVSLLALLLIFRSNLDAVPGMDVNGIRVPSHTAAVLPHRRDSAIVALG